MIKDPAGYLKKHVPMYFKVHTCFDHNNNIFWLHPTDHDVITWIEWWEDNDGAYIVKSIVISQFHVDIMISAEVE